MMSLQDELRLQRKKNRLTPIDNVNLFLLEEQLKILRDNDPNKGDLFFRLAIIKYEEGDLNRAIVYAKCFEDKCLFKGKNLSSNDVMGEGKLAMADLLIQLHFFCLEVGWNFDELHKLGYEHLDERYKKFKEDGLKKHG